MKKRTTEIDWRAVWKEFDAWYEDAEDRCTSGGMRWWATQKKAIQRIIEKQLAAQED
ncbi:MAG: hypothetical protein WAP47_08660 [Candidatus Rokuibacteriota bacterium]